MKELPKWLRQAEFDRYAELKALDWYAEGLEGFEEGFRFGARLVLIL